MGSPEVTVLEGWPEWCQDGSEQGEASEAGEQVGRWRSTPEVVRKSGRAEIKRNRI